MHVLYMSLQVLVCQSKLLVTKLKLEEQTKQSSSHPITTTMWCSIAPDRRKLSQTWTSAAHTRTHTHIHVLTKCIQTADLSLFLSHRHTLKLKPAHTHTHTFLCMHNVLWASHSLHKLDTNTSEWLICTCTQWPIPTLFLLQPHVVHSKDFTDAIAICWAPNSNHLSVVFTQ